jgi:cobaltochelatase CobS
MLNQENKAKVESLTHPQLRRLRKVMAIRCGDYMKLGKEAFSAMVSNAMNDSTFESDMARAFPEGIFTKGYKRDNTSETKAKYTADECHSAAAVEAATVTVTNTADSNSGDPLEVLRKLLSPKVEINSETIREIVKKELAGVVFPVTVQIQTDAKEPVKLEGFHHRRFVALLNKVKAGLNVWVYGPAGTGKTTGAENVAKALGLEFYCNGTTDTEHKLKGYQDIQGRYISTQFRQAFEHGGVYCGDEIDSWLPSATMGLQAACANGHCDFPDKRVTRHPNFIMIACANTVGHGSTADYVGRNRMDGAFLDRFVYQPWEIDETLERAITGNELWVTYVQDCRKRAQSKGLKVIISPRASLYGARMLACGDTWEEAAQACIRKSMTDEQWNAVRG